MEDETLEIEFSGGEQPLPIHDVQDWLRRQQIPSLTVEQKPPTVTPDHMGAVCDTLLVVTGAKYIKAVVKSVFSYLAVKRPKIKLKIKTKTWEVTLEGE